MFMRCKVTSRTILELRSMTKEEWVVEVLKAEGEVEDLVEIMDK